MSIHIFTRELIADGYEHDGKWNIDNPYGDTKIAEDLMEAFPNSELSTVTMHDEVVTVTFGQTVDDDELDAVVEAHKAKSFLLDEYKERAIAKVDILVKDYVHTRYPEHRQRFELIRRTHKQENAPFFGAFF